MAELDSEDPELGFDVSAGNVKGPLTMQELGITLAAATTASLNMQIRMYAEMIIAKAFKLQFPYGTGVAEPFNEFYNNDDDGGFQTVFRDLIDSKTTELIQTQVQRAGGSRIYLVIV